MLGLIGATEELLPTYLLRLSVSGVMLLLFSARKCGFWGRFLWPLTTFTRKSRSGKRRTKEMSLIKLMTKLVRSCSEFNSRQRIKLYGFTLLLKFAGGTFPRRYLPQKETRTHTYYAIMLKLIHEHTPIAGVVSGEIPTYEPPSSGHSEMNSSLKSSYRNAQLQFKCDMVLKR